MINKFRLVIGFIILFLLPGPAFASTLHLSPGSGTIAIGGTTSVQIRLNTRGDVVNGVSAFLSYPADKLDVAWVGGGSAFAIEAEKSYGGGIIKVSRGSLSGISGNVAVATIGFRGKTAGSAAVTFIGGSAAPRTADSSDSLNLGASSGGVFNVAVGAPKPSAKASANTDNGNNALAQLIISGINTGSISTNSAEISWKTNGEADSLIEYGIEKDKYFLTASNTKLETDHKIKLDNAFLGAGMKLHFRIKSKDADGHETISGDQELQLLGYQVKIKVTDESGKPLQGIEVFLYSDPLKAVTDANGEAVFNNVSPGKHLAVVKSADGDKSTEVLVAENTPSGVSTNATVKVKSPVMQLLVKQIQVILLAITVIAVVLIVAGVIALKRGKRRTGPPKNSIPPQTNSNISGVSPPPPIGESS